MSDVDDARTLIEADWLVHGKWKRLHYADLTPEQVAEFAEDYMLPNAVFACGKPSKGEVYIPGVITRMGAKRCDGCCDAKGLPRGKGSPKNDPECRRVLGLDDGRTL